LPNFYFIYAFSDSTTSITSKFVVKWKGHGRKRSWPNLRHYIWHSFGKIEDNNEEPKRSSVGHDMILRSPRADERWGKSVQITGARRPGKEPEYMAYVFVFLGSISICRSFKSTLSDQAQVTLQLRVSHFDFVSSILAGPSLLTRRQRNKFLTGTRTCSR
jgi:hypothetical protein